MLLGIFKKKKEKEKYTEIFLYKHSKSKTRINLRMAKIFKDLLNFTKLMKITLLFSRPHYRMGRLVSIGSSPNVPPRMGIFSRRGRPHG